MLGQMTFEDMLGVTSSQGSEDGSTHSDLRDGLRSGECGQAQRHVSRSVWQGEEEGQATSGICGLSSRDLSASADLQRSLASRLRALLDGAGSVEYSLTWKEWAIDGQEPICAQRAVARRTSVSGCSGWPTCSSRDGKGGYAGGRIRDGRLSTDVLDVTAQLVAGSGLCSPASCRSATAVGSLGVSDAESIIQSADVLARPRTELSTQSWEAFCLAGWPTPQTAEPGGPPRPSREATGRKSEYLGRTVELAGWSTPKGNERDAYPSWTKTRNGEQREEPNLAGEAVFAGWPTPNCDDPNNATRTSGQYSSLTRTVQIAGWHTPKAHETNEPPGQHARRNGDRSLTSTGSLGEQAQLTGHGQCGGRAGTASCGGCLPVPDTTGWVLNAAFSAWLMGYPVAWTEAGFRSARKKRGE